MIDGVQQGFPGVTGAYAPQFAPQGILGNLTGVPLGGMIGSGIPGLFGQQQQHAGRQIGHVANGIGSFTPFAAVDPVTAAYLQQAGQIGGLGNSFGRFGVDPIAAQQAQQLAQLAQLVQLVQQLAQQVQLTQLTQQAQFANQGLPGHGVGQWGHGQLGRVAPFQAGPMGMAGGYGWQGLPVY